MPKVTWILANLAEAVLEFEGKELGSTTDFGRLEKLYLLFTEAELLGHKPKTHSVGCWSEPDSDFSKRRNNDHRIGSGQ